MLLRILLGSHLNNLFNKFLIRYYQVIKAKSLKNQKILNKINQAYRNKVAKIKTETKFTNKETIKK